MRNCRRVKQFTWSTGSCIPRRPEADVNSGSIFIPTLPPSKSIGAAYINQSPAVSVTSAVAAYVHYFVQVNHGKP